jgi:Transglutaminase-like superfamily
LRNPKGLLRRWGYRLRKLVSLPGAELIDLLVAQAALLKSWWWVRSRPVGTLLRSAPSAEEGMEPAGPPLRLQRLALAVERAAEHGLFRATCLVRAVALEDMISRSNTPGAVVRIGVLTREGKLLAHAWIEFGGRVLADRPEHVRHFTVLHDFTALQR